MTSSTWIRLPPILRPKPKSQRANRMMMIVHSMIIKPRQCANYYSSMDFICSIVYYSMDIKRILFMPMRKKSGEKDAKRADADFFEQLWEKSWTYIKTVVDVVREPVLILDQDFRVMAANDAFYETFHAKLKDTENKIVYQLGNGQWNIPSLHKLLDDILQRNTFFKGYQVAHEFPGIGRKVIILNGRQIYVKEHNESGSFPPFILLAMEDVTEMMVVAETLANHNDQLATKFAIRTQKLEMQIEKLEHEIAKLKKKA